MRLTLPHYYAFGDDLPEGRLDNPGAWDHLRTQTSGPFAMARTRQELAAMLAGRPELAQRARAISRLVDESLASYGVGAGVLEHGLDVAHLTLTDMAPATVAQLSVLFPAARVVRHDLRAGPLDAELHLFHRVDTEFTNRDWRRIFRAFADQRVLFVPGGMQPAKVMLRAVYITMRERRQVRAGLLRTRAATEALWRETHRDVWLDETEGWILEPR
jgi:hypothetical protein